jgi:p-aminobenzoyl-glutamate transporter AbgT
MLNADPFDPVASVEIRFAALALGSSANILLLAIRMDLAQLTSGDSIHVLQNAYAQGGYDYFRAILEVLFVLFIIYFIYELGYEVAMKRRRYQIRATVKNTCFRLFKNWILDIYNLISIIAILVRLNFFVMEARASALTQN